MSDLQANELLPTFIGIGAPKTATTFLDQCLKEHPEIFMPLSKEPHFFGSAYHHGVNEYLRFFEGAERYNCRGEISTSYFHHPAAAGRIKDLIPNAKIILSVRNPVEQVYSLYWQSKRHNFYQSVENDINLTFSQALNKYPERLLEPARYHTHLKRWLELFPNEQVYILFYDDVKVDPKKALSGVYKFLGVSVDQGLANLQSSNRTVLGGIQPRNALIGKLYGFVYMVLNKYGFSLLKKSIGYKRTLWIKDRLRIRTILGAVFFRRGYPKISQQDKAKVLELFLAEIEGLEHLTGRDLSSWKSV
ncbi:MAG: sulfotransferase domain-containing protein [Gammaproteobacteria bacterium]|nr:sulfotransferase domain-containing protein [Gammaproteobacteria bacterium]